MPRPIIARSLLLVTLALFPSAAAAAGAADGAWRALAPPPRGTNAILVRDDAHHRLLTWNAFAAGGDPNVYALSLDGARVWTRLPVVGPTPPPREWASAIYDPARDRLLMFGGISSNTYFNEVWALPLTGTPIWTRLKLTSTPPFARILSSVVYDSVRDRLIVFGGESFLGAFSDTWAVALSGPNANTWRMVRTRGSVTPRFATPCAFDAAENRLIIWAGSTASGAITDAQALVFDPAPSDSATWVGLAPAGPAPAPRVEESFAWDASRRQLIIYSGVCCAGTLFTDMWALRFSPTTAWVQLTPPPGPTPRQGSTGAYDPVNDRFVVFNGWDYATGYLNDSWELQLGPLGPWSEVIGAPRPQKDPPFVLDPETSRALTYDASALWALSTESEPTWSRIAAPTGAPAARRATILDPIRRRLLTFGASGVSALDLSNPVAWTALSTTGSPPLFSMPTVVYDPVRDRALVFDGTAATDHAVWQLTFASTPAWSLLTVAGTPPPNRVRPMAAYDASADRMIVYGGDALNDVWQLTLDATPTWGFIDPAWNPPPPGAGSSVAVDLQRQRLIVLGGAGGGLSALSLVGIPTWTSLTPIGSPKPTATSTHRGAVYDPSHDRLLVHGGEDYIDAKLISLNRTFELAFSGILDAPRPPSAPGSLAFSLVAPDPASGEQRFEWSRPADAGAALSIFDVTGKRVWLRSLAAGETRAKWTGVGENGRAVAPGVYFAQLVIGADVAQRRIVRLW